ncbi:MAG: hypothetical protein RJA99_125 [Pseudomonadota bacterium]|jgi:hypothetical protein
MTDPARTAVRCAACGTDVDVPVVPAVNAIGSPDLDTRPPGAARPLVALRVQHCPECGHCGTDLAALLPGAKDGLAEDDYRELLDDASLPPLARHWLCTARLQSAAGRLDDAFWSTLSAAWITDDIADPEAGARCRLLAVFALRLARAAGKPVARNESVAEVVEVDLLRRAGEFADARRCARRALERPREAVVERLLRFELDLVDAQDRDAHPVSEAVEGDD